jgi:hypothetical protein
MRLLPAGFVLPEAIVPVVITPDFYVGIEDQDGITLVHCSVWRWGPGVARAIRTAFDQVLAAHGGPLFGAARRPHGNDFVKFAKFCRWVGFEFHLAACVDGVKHDVYVRWR